mmetsp:Transcript_42839/g.100539  ORF Transcript_42839/g.100539 Transcript_42839/m.100539 type:complete len:251 (-) Transcript_42839:1534-2286(-)
MSGAVAILPQVVARPSQPISSRMAWKMFPWPKRNLGEVIIQLSLSHTCWPGMPASERTSRMVRLYVLWCFGEAYQSSTRVTGSVSRSESRKKSSLCTQTSVMWKMRRGALVEHALTLHHEALPSGKAVCIASATAAVSGRWSRRARVARSGSIEKGGHARLLRLTPAGAKRTPRIIVEVRRTGSSTSSGEGVRGGGDVEGGGPAAPMRGIRSPKAAYAAPPRKKATSATASSRALPPPPPPHSNPTRDPP